MASTRDNLCSDIGYVLIEGLCGLDGNDDITVTVDDERWAFDLRQTRVQINVAQYGQATLQSLWAWHFSRAEQRLHGPYCLACIVTAMSLKGQESL